MCYEQLRAGGASGNRLSPNTNGPLQRPRPQKEGHVKRQSAIERRIEKIKKELVKLSDMRPGSLSVQTRGWGGEYCQLSYTHQGKGRTEYVPKNKRKEVERQLANYHKFRELTKEWVELSIELCKLKTQDEKKPEAKSKRQARVEK